MELFETNESDVTPFHDSLVSIPKLATKGVRVFIRLIKERKGQRRHDVKDRENSRISLSLKKPKLDCLYLSISVRSCEVHKYSIFTGK